MDSVVCCFKDSKNKLWKDGWLAESEPGKKKRKWREKTLRSFLSESAFASADLVGSIKARACVSCIMHHGYHHKSNNKQNTLASCSYYVAPWRYLEFAGYVTFLLTESMNERRAAKKRIDRFLHISHYQTPLLTLFRSSSLSLCIL